MDRMPPSATAVTNDKDDASWMSQWSHCVFKIVVVYICGIFVLLPLSRSNSFCMLYTQKSFFFPFCDFKLR